MTDLDVAAPPTTPTSTRTPAPTPVVPGPRTAPGHPGEITAIPPPWARPGQDTLTARDLPGQSELLPAPRQRQPPPPGAEQKSWPQVWAALDRARATYDPQVLDTAERAVLQCYRPAAQAVANNAAPAHGLDQPHAETLAELALTKAIRQCRAWDIHGFELYVHAAVESELRTNARPAPVPPLPASR